MNYNAHVVDYFAEKPEKAYAFLNPYIQCRYGRIGVRVPKDDGSSRKIEYILMSLVYYPYGEENCWEEERPCTEEEVEYIGIIRSLYDVSEELPVKGISSYTHLKLGSRKCRVEQVLLVA